MVTIFGIILYKYTLYNTERLLFNWSKIFPIYNQELNFRLFCHILWRIIMLIYITKHTMFICHNKKIQQLFWQIQILVYVNATELSLQIVHFEKIFTITCTYQQHFKWRIVMTIKLWSVFSVLSHIQVKVSSPYTRYFIFFFFFVVRRLVLESTINCDCFLIVARPGTSPSSSPLSSSSAEKIKIDTIIMDKVTETNVQIQWMLKFMNNPVLLQMSHFQ